MTPTRRGWIVLTVLGCALGGLCGWYAYLLPWVVTPGITS